MKTLSRGLSLVALVAWGSLMLYFFFSGRLNQYLIPAYRPLVALSGFVMLGIAGSLAFGMRRGARVPVFADEGGGADDLSAPNRVRATQVLAFALLVLPIWAASGVSKDGFGANAILNRGIVSDSSHLPGKPASLAAVNATTPAKTNAPAPVEPPLPGATPAPPDNSPLDASQYLKTTADGHVIAEVTDLLFASDDDSMRPAFEGKTVEMIGQFMPVKDATDGRFQIVRMFMVCCAADARPVAIHSLPPAKDAKLPTEMAWTKVVGKVTFPLENGRRVPLIHADKVTPCEPPSEAMLY